MYTLRFMEDKMSEEGIMDEDETTVQPNPRLRKSEIKEKYETSEKD